MLLATQFFLSTKVVGTDAPLGRIDDLLFDDNSWGLRYLVIDTRSWLPGRKVVLTPAELTDTAWLAKEIKVDRTRQEIEDSPPLEEHEPVSQQRESQLADYFDWPRLWGTSDALGTETPMGVGSEVAEAGSKASREEFSPEGRGDPHLRSCTHLKGYEVVAKDGELGAIQNLIIDTEGWRIDQLVVAVDDSKWLTNTLRSFEPESVDKIDWEQRHLALDLTLKAIELRPEFNSNEPVNRVYEQQSYDYFGRPRTSASLAD